MHIPTLLKSPGTELPDLEVGGMRYVVASNGTFCERRAPMFMTSTRVDERDLKLAEHDERCSLTCGRLPRALHRAMLTFFVYAHEVHGGEAALVLLYHPARRRFRWHCPIQTVDIVKSYNRWVAADYIHYDNPLSLPDGYLHFGDAHLHPGPPTPSAMDVNDDQDGLHIIVGNIKTEIRYNLDFVMGGVRFRMAPEQFFEALNVSPYKRPPKSWLRQIKLRRCDRFSWEKQPTKQK